MKKGDSTLLTRLEKEIREGLRQTGLARNIKIHRGDVKDPNQGPYLEFRFDDKIPPEDVERYEYDGCKLKRTIADRIVKNWSEVSMVETQRVDGRVFREYLRINPQAKMGIEQEGDLRRGVLEIVLSELKNYNLR